MNEFVTLYKKLEGFRISGVSNMNDILIEDYWNKDLDTPINTREHEAMLNRDRKVLNFTLRDLHEAISSGKIQYPADTEIDYN